MQRAVTMARTPWPVLSPPCFSDILSNDAVIKFCEHDHDCTQAISEFAKYPSFNRIDFVRLFE